MDEFFASPQNRLIMEALAAHDDKRPINWDYVITGKRNDFNKKH